MPYDALDRPKVVDHQLSIVKNFHAARAKLFETLAASKVSILDKCSSVVYMLCIVHLQRMANCLDTGNRVFVFGRKTGKKRKEKDKKKKLPRNRLTFYTRANEAPSSPEFRLHVNPETDDGDSFRRDFSDWFSACLAVEIILRSPCKTRVSFPPSIFPLYFTPHFFPHIRWNFIDTPWV